MKFDALIVAGGGQLDDYWGGPWGHPYALLKWSLITRLLHKKLLFVSVGRDSLNSPLSQVFIFFSLYLAHYRSYRDEISKHLLNNFSFTHKDLVYPDLAFCYPRSNNYNEHIFDINNFVIGVSPIAYLSNHAWPKKNIALYYTYLSVLSSFIENLLSRNCRIILFSTDKPDQHAIDDIFTLLKHKNQDESLKRVNFCPTQSIRDLERLLISMDVIVASRLHGVLISHLLNRPVIAISYNRKVNTHMNNMSLSQYCLNIHEFQTEQICKIFDNIISNFEQIKNNISKNINENSNLLKEQYNRLKHILN